MFWKHWCKEILPVIVLRASTDHLSYTWHYVDTDLCSIMKHNSVNRNSTKYAPDIKNWYPPDDQTMNDGFCASRILNSSYSGQLTHH
jgi:uncharacterized protein YtpQ (UPF0354 family)